MHTSVVIRTAFQKHWHELGHVEMDDAMIAQVHFMKMKAKFGCSMMGSTLQARSAQSASQVVVLPEHCNVLGGDNLLQFESHTQCNAWPCVDRPSGVQAPSQALSHQASEVGRLPTIVF